jgi:hypothetical protein
MEYTIQEVEHENLVLAQELVNLYKKKISELESEILNLKSLLNQAPIPVGPVQTRRKVGTISELREILETRSSKVVGKEIPNA